MKVSRRDNCDRYYVLQAFGFGLFVHRMHTDEAEGVFHSHPWSGFSIILGEYTEQYRGEQPRVRRFWNWIRAERFHRVTLPRGPVWSIFFHLRRFNRWAVKSADGTMLVVEPWRTVGGPTAYAPTKEDR